MDLRAAAERLSVHYQTAYRWVRSGVLPAVKVANSYQVDEADVDRLVRQRQAPAPPPARIDVRDWAAQVRKLHAALVAGDEHTVREMIDRLVEGGVGVVDLCQALLAPAMAGVGQDWADGRISIAEEHRASAIGDRQLARISGQPRGRPRGVAVVAAVVGERHALPTAMAAAALRNDRWHVHHLGVDVPVDDLISLAKEVAADVVVLSATTPGIPTLPTAEAVAGAGFVCLTGAPGASLEHLLVAARASRIRPARTRPAGGAGDDHRDGRPRP